MQKVYINVPIWSSRAVGIKEKYLEDDLMVEILYKDVHGNRVYPHTYLAKKEKVEYFGRQIINDKVTLIIFPIADLEIMSEDEMEEAEYKRSIGLNN